MCSSQIDLLNQEWEFGGREKERGRKKEKER